MTDANSMTFDNGRMKLSRFEGKEFEFVTISSDSTRVDAGKICKALEENNKTVNVFDLFEPIRKSDDGNRQMAKKSLAPLFQDCVNGFAVMLILDLKQPADKLDELKVRLVRRAVMHMIDKKRKRSPSPEKKKKTQKPQEPLLKKRKVVHPEDENKPRKAKAKASGSDSESDSVSESGSGSGSGSESGSESESGSGSSSGSGSDSGSESDAGSDGSDSDSDTGSSKKKKTKHEKTSPLYTNDDENDNSRDNSDAEEEEENSALQTRMQKLSIHCPKCDTVKRGLCNECSKRTNKCCALGCNETKDLAETFTGYGKDPSTVYSVCEKHLDSYRHGIRGCKTLVLLTPLGRFCIECGEIPP